MAGSEEVGGIHVRITASVEEANEKFRQLEQEASRTAQAVRKGGETAAEGSELTSRGLRNVVQSGKLAAGTIATELNPALGQMVFAMSAASREGLRFSLTTSAMLIGVAAAGVAFSQLIQEMSRATERTAALNVAVRAVDLGTLRSQAAELAQTFERLSIAQEKGGITGFIAQQIELAKILFRNLVKEQKETTEGLAAIQGPLRERAVLDTTLKLIDARKQLAGLEAGRAREIEDLETFNFETGRTTVLFLEQAKALENLARLKAKTLLGQPGITAEERTTINLGVEQDLAAIQAATRTQTRQNFLAIETGRQAIAEARGLRLAREAEARGAPPGQEAADIARREDLITAREIRTEEEKRAELQTQRIGLSQAERDQLELARIAVAQRNLEEDERLTIQQKQTKELELQIAQFNIIRQRELRDNPMAGWSEGIREVGEEFTSLGTLMKDGAHRIGEAMAQSLSSTFFNVVTGKFKELTKLPEAFGRAVIQTFTDIAAKAVVGSTFQSLGLRAFLPAFGFGGGGGGPVPVTLAQAQTLEAQGVQIISGGTGTGGLFAVPGTGGTGAGGGFGLGNISNIPLPPGLLNWLTGGGGVGAQAALVGANVGAVGAEAALVGANVGAVGAEVGTVAAAGTGLAGAGLGQALPIAGTVIAAGLTVYSAVQAFQAGQTGTGVGILVGAGVGFAVAGPIGLAIGAIIGGAIGSKANAKGKSTKQKQAEEVAAVSRLTSSLISALNAAKTREDIERALQQAAHPATGGAAGLEGAAGFIFGLGRGLERGILSFGGVWLGGWTVPQLTIDDVLADPANFRAAEQQGVGNKESFNAPVEQAFRAAAARVSQAESALRFGFEERLVAPGVLGPGGVTRATILPFSRRRQVPAGMDLTVFEETLLGLDDDVKQQFLEELARVDRDGDLRLIRTDESIPITTGRFPGGVLQPPERPLSVFPPGPPLPPVLPPAGEFLFTGGGP